MGDTAMSDRKDMSKKIDTRYAIGRKEANAYNTQELEECDYGTEETSILSAFDRQQLTFHFQTSISSNQVN